jgi:ribosome-binding ATPase YchF (GTP1/OBG family)
VFHLPTVFWSLGSIARFAMYVPLNSTFFHNIFVLVQGAKIQLLDLPGIIEGAKDGKGRGRQVKLPLIILI